MATFPPLKTGAVTQYPAELGIRFRNDLRYFVDGTAQAYRDYPLPLRRWIIRLDRLDPAETRTLEEFYRDHRGSFGTFSFVDPTNQIEYSACSFEHDQCSWEYTSEARGRGALVIRQNRD